MIYFISFIISLVSIILISGITGREIKEWMEKKAKARTKPIKKIIRQSKTKSRRSSLSDLESSIRDFLTRTGRPKYMDYVIILSLVLSLLSVPLSIAVGNIFLLPFFSILFFSLPFAIVLIWKNSYEKKEYSELETAMSLVTTSYMRCQDIPSSFKENIEYFRSPVKEAFSAFTMRIQNIDPDIKRAIRELKRQFPYRIFGEWCDELIMCSTDRSKSDMLPRTVSRMTDERLVNLEIAPLLSSARKEFFTMAIMVLLNFPLLKILNEEWFSVMTDTIQGKIVTSLVLCAILITTFLCFKLTKRVTYSRGSGS